MAMLERFLVVFCLISFVSACGGGGGSSSGGQTPTSPTPSPPTPSEIISDPQNHSAAELKIAAKKLVDTGYRGQNTDANIDSELSQQVFAYLFAETTVEIPNLADNIFIDQLDENGNIDINFACFHGGSVSYKGKLNDNLVGKIFLSYSNCNTAQNGFPITGKVALNVIELTENSFVFEYYIDGLNWQLGNDVVRLSGFSLLSSEADTNLNAVTIENEQYALFTINNQQQLFLDATIEVREQDFVPTINLSGSLYIKDTGKIAFEFNGANGFPPFINTGELLLTGDKAATLKFEDHYVRYQEDENKDGIYETGAFLSKVDLYNGETVARQLVPIAEMSLPPVIYSPWVLNSSELNTTAQIEVEPGYISDPDTPLEQLQISFRWYINEEEVEGQITNILPPYLAVFGDKLEVSMIVSDSANTIESELSEIYLQDAPAEITVSNLPESIKPGDRIEFLVEVSDPDIATSDGTGGLISGPDGASINEDGLVSWTVPDNFYFSYQSFEFTFGIPQEDGSYTDIKAIPIRVDSDKAFPLARSGMEVPKSNKSMWVGDFDGDNLNEVLSTNGNSSIFLLEYKNGDYQQKWVYPFKVNSQGLIKQVLAANVDEDPEQEIIVVTENGISLISSLTSLSTELISVDEVILFATLEDIDGNGTPELAYLTGSGYYNEDIILNVVSLDNLDEPLFTSSVSNARQIQFSNVDQDNNLELITNNGLVYDAVTWENQWFSGNEFGDSLLTTGDYNGDDINEIVGADRWGNLAVYSATNKSQLDSFDNFNTCDLHSADINDDGTDELLVGDCQWGNITAYKLVDSELTELWSVSMQDHGSVSLTTGDSDNDGILEVHWGSGISTSGADIFVSADIDGDSVTLKEAEDRVQLDQYSSAGWSHITDSQDRAVFLIPSTGSGYEGSRVATLDILGNMEISEEISSNWDNSSFAVTTDFNNDGFGDIFLPSSSLYDGAFSALQLSDMSKHWSTSGDFDSTIGFIRAKDFNGDDFEDAIYIDGNILKAIDIENQTIIATFSFDSQINDFVPLIVDGSSAVVVAFGDKLSYLTVSGSVFAEQSFIEQSCDRVELINYDTDSDLELACLLPENGYNDNTALVIFEFDGQSLVEENRASIIGNVIDMAVDPTKGLEQNLFITSYSGDRYGYGFDNSTNHQIKKITPQGRAIWASPSLVGRPSDYGLKVRLNDEQKLEMMLSTNQMMYWID